MYLTIQGLVLRVTAYNDWDSLLTLLTRDHGKLTVKARGLRRKNSRLTASCQILVLGEFTLFEHKGMYTINEAHPIELFQGLRKDLRKLALATYFAQVAEVISQEDMPNPQLLTLVLNSMYALSNMDVAEEIVKAVFELRCTNLAGYTPDLYACHSCGNHIPDMFDTSAGRLECRRCRSADSAGLRMPVSAGALKAMRYIAACEEKRIFSFRVASDSMQQLSQIAEVYLTTQLERGFSTLDFYKSLLLE